MVTLISDDAADAAYVAFHAHGDAKAFLNHPTRKFICNECDAELADVTALRRHCAKQAIIAAQDAANPTGSVGS